MKKTENRSVSVYDDELNLAELVQKGWYINSRRVIFKGCDEWELSEFSVLTNNRNKARSFIINKYRASSGIYITNIKGEEINYKNIPITRWWDLDMLRYNGKVIPRIYLHEEVHRVLKAREEAKILANENITHCYILKKGYYYKDGYCGYTEDKMYAGVYKKEDAILHCKGILECNVIPIDVDTHNALIDKHISGVLARKIVKPIITNQLELF